MSRRKDAPRKLAEQIARDLFVVYGGQPTTRLALEFTPKPSLRDTNGFIAPGWCPGAVVDVVERALRAGAQRRPRTTRRTG